MTDESSIPDCPLCGSTTARRQVYAVFSFHVDCDRCGRYLIARRLASDLQSPKGDPLRAPLSWKVREATDLGVTLEITFDNVESLSTLEGWPVSRKLSRLLEEVARATA